MRRVLLSAVIVIAAGAFLVIAGGSSNSSGNSTPTYRVELDNAFGLVNGADFKVAGVRAGTIKSIDLCSSDKAAHCQNPLNAVITVQVTQPGFGSFHTDAFCQSRPQSLIGEYFVDCNPGQKAPVLKPGGTIPVTRTQSTIPADLVQNVMRLPYRERFTLIINELGAAVAGRSDDLQAALRRAVPALTQTDNLLNLLANDAHTLRDLNVNADQVVTALAQNKGQVQRFIDEAKNAAADTATQKVAFQQSWHKLPAFLEQLRPALADLSTAVQTNTPVLQNLNAAAGNLRRFFVDLTPFSNASRISLTCGENGQAACPFGGASLGTASVTGKSAVQASAPLISHLNTFARSSPELDKNLAIVLHDIDDRSRAVEADPRSPGGKGFTGLEAVLQYVFNQALAINYFNQYGHLLAVDAFANQTCSPYATPRGITSNLASNPKATRQCYSWIGPNQPGINEADPSNPHGCVPDPGAEPPFSIYVPKGAHPTTGTNVRKCSASGPAKDTTTAAPSNQPRSTNSAAPARAPNPTAPTVAKPALKTPKVDLGKTLNKILSLVGSTTSGVSSAAGNAPGGNQAQQLLNYLLAP